MDFLNKARVYAQILHFPCINEYLPLQFYLRKLLLACICLLISISYGQTNRITPKQQSADTIKFCYSIQGNVLVGSFPVLSNDFLGLKTLFCTKEGKLISGSQVPVEEPYFINVRFPNDELLNDSVYLRIDLPYGPGLKYLPERISPVQGESNCIVFGRNCIKTECIIPQNPYMPQLVSPVLIYLNKHYLDWATGRIMIGRKATQHYDPCKLKELLLVDKEKMYYDKIGTRRNGAELITKKRIKTKNWNKEVFEQP